MPDAGKAKRALRPLSEMSDVYDLLEEVRLRPAMWVCRNELRHLSSILVGYGIALDVHGVEAPFDFGNPGTRSRILRARQ